MTFDDVCAVLITRGDVDMNWTKSLPYKEILFVYPNFTAKWVDQELIETFPHPADQKIYGRYYAAEHFTDLPYVYFQDDDVRFIEHEKLLNEANAYPGLLIANMYDEWIEGMQYFDLAMVGLGSLCPNGLWCDAFARWQSAYGEDAANDERFMLDPDFIFGVLCPWVRFDFGHEILDIASDPSRLSLQPGQHERKYETIQMARSIRQVVLTMLTKNEESNIVRALSSAQGLFHKLLIHDSGSTDDTKLEIGRWCAANGIPFTIRDTEWQGFMPARNALLTEGRMLGDYMLLMDADEEFMREPDTTWPPLEMDVHVLHYAGPVDYGQPRLIRSNFPVQFVGKKHSALEWDYVARGADLRSPVIEHHGDFTHGSGDVYDRIRNDIVLLTEDIDEGNDVAHNLFNRAKAYEGLSEWALARADYEARLDCEDADLEGVPAEQRYYSRFRLGVIYVEHFNKFAEGADCLMTAWFDRPKRVESIRALAHYLTMIADATPYPENEIVFVHRDQYKQPQGG